MTSKSISQHYNNLLDGSFIFEEKAYQAAVTKGKSPYASISWLEKQRSGLPEYYGASSKENYYLALDYELQEVIKRIRHDAYSNSWNSNHVKVENTIFSDSDIPESLFVDRRNALLEEHDSFVSGLFEEAQQAGSRALDTFDWLNNQMLYVEEYSWHDVPVAQYYKTLINTEIKEVIHDISLSALKVEWGEDEEKLDEIVESADNQNAPVLA